MKEQSVRAVLDVLYQTALICDSRADKKKDVDQALTALDAIVKEVIGEGLGGCASPIEINREFVRCGYCNLCVQDKTKAEIRKRWNVPKK